MDNFGESDEYDPIDIDATLVALRAAWKCMPHMGLIMLLDTVSSAPLCDLTDEELRQELNNFTHENK